MTSLRYEACQSWNANGLVNSYNSLAIHNETKNQSVAVQINCMSSNGYYGYTPIQVPVAENSMEICESDVNGCYQADSPAEETTANTLAMDYTCNKETKLSLNISFASRKRNITEEALEEPKRQKLEESIYGNAFPPVVIQQSPRKLGLCSSRCTMASLGKCVVRKNEAHCEVHVESIEDNELSELLLKGIHGCDLYNYEIYDE